MAGRLLYTEVTTMMYGHLQTQIRRLFRLQRLM